MDERVVVGVDGSANSLRALAWAAGDAAVRGGLLQVVTVWLPDAGSGAGFGGGASEAAARLDRSLHEVAARTRGVAMEKLVLAGETAPILCAVAAGASVMVVGWRGFSGVAGAMLGSVSLRCVRHSSVPVVVVPPDHPGVRPRAGVGEPGRILVGIDRSPGAAAALTWAIGEAVHRHWEIDAAEVGREPYQEDMALELDMPHFRRERPGLVRASRERLEQFVAGVAEAAGVAGVAGMTDAAGVGGLAAGVGGAAGGVGAGGVQAPVAIRPLLLDGDPDTVLCDRSAGADLLVVGSKGRGGLARVVLGSVSTRCAHHSRCPVAIVPTGAPVTPGNGD